jgi:hypothetical protein
MNEARALARRLDKPFALVHANGFGLTDVLRGDLTEVCVASEEAVQLSTKLGFPTYRTFCKTIAAWAKAQIDPGTVTREIIDSLRRELELSQPLFREFALSILAETQALIAAPGEVLATLAEALASNPEELWCRPLTLQLRGKLYSHLGRDSRDLASAENDFIEAISISRRMCAKSAELRATISFGRLMRDTNRRDQARTMLSEVYNWFTEGFDTADLKEAKALLKELGT